MSTRAQIFSILLFAAILCAGTLSFRSLAWRKDGPSPGTGAACPEIAKGEGALEAIPGEAAAEGPQGTEVAERPVEEILAECGEDPGAVFYTSRIREAIREENPAFARELLRQMRELHPDSVLIGEAEALVDPSVTEGSN